MSFFCYLCFQSTANFEVWLSAAAFYEEGKLGRHPSKNLHPFPHTPSFPERTRGKYCTFLFLLDQYFFAFSGRISSSSTTTKKICVYRTRRTLHLTQFSRHSRSSSRFSPPKKSYVGLGATTPPPHCPISSRPPITLGFGPPRSPLLPKGLYF